MDNTYKFPYTYTFIIPHRNSPNLLERCLQSIPFRNDIQIIIVDDNSDSDKKPLVRRKNVEVIYLNKEESKGAGRARNVGLAKAKGKWLLFADCDDYYVDGFINELDKYKDYDIDVLYYNFNFVDSNGINFPKSKLQKALESYNGSKEDLDCIKYFNNSPWSKMVLHNYVIYHKVYFEEVVNGNDVLFSYFIASYTNRIEINKNCLYNYIKNNNSITFKKQTNEEVICRIRHIVITTFFLRKIGVNFSYKNSIISFLKRLYSLNYKHILPFIKILFFDILKNRNEWVEIINNHK